MGKVHGIPKEEAPYFRWRRKNIALHHGFVFSLLIHGIDSSNTGLISKHKYNEFLKGFGPEPKVMSNVFFFVASEF